LVDKLADRFINAGEKMRISKQDLARLRAIVARDEDEDAESEAA